METIGSPASLLGAASCRNFEPGARVFDVDTELPQGLIVVVVPPISPGSLPDWTAPYIQISGPGAQQGGSRSFKVTTGFVGEFAWAPYGSYHVTIGSGPWTGPQHRVLAETSVTIDHEHPHSVVTLQIPAGALGCDDGWWSACQTRSGTFR